MDALIHFLTDAQNWQGATGIPNRLFEHLLIALLSVVTAAAVGLPAGLWMGHTGRGALLGINLANIGRAIPSYAVLAMILPVSLSLAPVLGYKPGLGLSFIPVFGAMTLLAIPPILVGAYAGVRSVDQDLVESARGMGMQERQILFGIELPLASPIVVGGIRTALLQVIGTATIGAIVSYGGLGRFILDGISNHNNGSLYAGVVLVAGLAIGADLVLGLIQRWLTPRALRPGGAGTATGGAG
jgi:osmoprotectant transport system permease protein